MFDFERCRGLPGAGVQPGDIDESDRLEVCSASVPSCAMHPSHKRPPA